MADPPAAIPSGITASERDVLLATKLYVPGPRPGLVPRPRLAERLREGLRRGVVLVCAPAGYGKMVLLAEWAQAASGRLPGCRWMPEITTRPGSGATRWPRWTTSARGSANGSPRCSDLPRRRRSRAWSRR